MSAQRRNSILALLTIAPLAFMVYAMQRFYVPLPIGDQWYFMPVLQAYYRGEFSWEHLWAPMNNHRAPVVKSVMVLMAILTHWNHAYEVGLGAIVAVGGFILLASTHRRGLLALESRNPLVGIPLLSLMSFSFVQARNLTWGWQLHIFVVCFFAVATLCVLARDPFRIRRFLAGVALAALATFSLASGVLVWGVALPIFAFSTGCAWRRRWVYMAAWCLLGVIFNQLYHIGFPVNMYPTTSPFSVPRVFAKFFLAELGAPVWYFGVSGAQVAGALGLALFCGLAVSMWRGRRGAAFQQTLPFFCYGLFGLLNAAAIAYGRAEMFPSSILASRYTTLTLPFWIGLVLAGILMVAKRRTGSTVSSTSRGYAVFIAGLAVLAVCVAASSIQGYRVHIPRHAYEVATADAMVRTDTYYRRPISRIATPLMMYPENRRAHLKELVSFMREHKLSAFRNADRLGEVPVDSYRILAQRFLEFGDDRGSINIYRLVISLAPEELDLYVELAQVFEDAGYKEDAKHMCRLALERDSDYAPAKRLLAKLLEKDVA